MSLRLAPSDPTTPTSLEMARKGNKDTRDAHKPRLTKEQHAILESHFLKECKPSIETKKIFATRFGVAPGKIVNWFQNRRARSKQDAMKRRVGYDKWAIGDPNSAGY